MAKITSDPLDLSNIDDAVRRQFIIDKVLRNWANTVDSAADWRVEEVQSDIFIITADNVSEEKYNKRFANG